MLIDITVPASPGWWLARLTHKLEDRRRRYDRLEAYYEGTSTPEILTSKATRAAYQRLMGMARTNFAELVVEAVRERMTVVGFRTGADGDELGDREAWRIWQANALDADSDLVHRDALVMGDAYVIVGGVDDEIGAPVITPEDPRQVITEQDPIRRRKAVAGLKLFHDDIAGLDRAYLYLPGVVYRATRKRRTDSTVYLQGLHGWEWEGADNLPFDTIPVVRFALRGRKASGEFEPHIPLLNRITDTVLHRMEVATLQAFRQRAIKGVPAFDENGVAIDYEDVFDNDPSAMWLLPESAEIWESGQVDLGPIRQAIRDDIQDLAAVTRTPLFYLTPEAANGSAEGASLAREGLIFKAGDRIKQASEPWEQVLSIAFLIVGDLERSSRRDMEALWAPPERHSLAERADAASKLANLVPWRTIQSTVLQFSPQEVDRMETERAMDAFMRPVQEVADATTNDPPVS